MGNDTVPKILNKRTEFITQWKQRLAMDIYLNSKTDLTVAHSVLHANIPTSLYSTPCRKQFGITRPIIHAKFESKVVHPITSARYPFKTAKHVLPASYEFDTQFPAIAKYLNM